MKKRAIFEMPGFIHNRMEFLGLKASGKQVRETDKLTDAKDYRPSKDAVKPKTEAQIARSERRKQRRQVKASLRLSKLVTPKEEARLAKKAARIEARRKKHAEALKAAA